MPYIPYNWHELQPKTASSVLLTGLYSTMPFLCLESRGPDESTWSLARKPFAVVFLVSLGLCVDRVRLMVYVHPLWERSSLLFQLGPFLDSTYSVISSAGRDCCSCAPFLLSPVLLWDQQMQSVVLNYPLCTLSTRDWPLNFHVGHEVSSSCFFSQKLFTKCRWLNIVVRPGKERSRQSHLLTHVDLWLHPSVIP